jgi:hypothetical protein
LSEELTTYNKFLLTIQAIGGLFLATGFLSLNIFEPGKCLRDFRQRVTAGTGVLVLFTTGLSWYGYAHYKIRCLACGLNLFTSVKWLLNGVVVVLLIYLVIVRTIKKPGARENRIDTESIAAGEGRDL